MTKMWMLALLAALPPSAAQAQLSSPLGSWPTAAGNSSADEFRSLMPLKRRPAAMPVK